MIFSERCCFTIGATALHDYTRTGSSPSELKERRIEAAGLGIHGPTTTSTRIRDQDIDPAPFLDDARHHSLNRFPVTYTDLYPGARRLDLGDRAVGGHLLGFGSKSS
jgi:hypothetical protein